MFGFSVFMKFYSNIRPVFMVKGLRKIFFVIKTKFYSCDYVKK